MITGKTVPANSWSLTFAGTACICIIFLNSFKWLPFLSGSYYPIIFQLTTLTITVIFLGATWALSRKIIALNLLDLLVILFVVYNCLNALIASNTSIFSYHKDINLYLSYLGFYWLLRVALPHLNLKWMQVVTGIFGGIVIIQFWIETILGNNYALRGFLVNTGIMAGFLCITIPITLANGYSGKQRFSPIAIVYVLVCLITIVAAGSRTAIIALVFILLIYLVMIKASKKAVVVGISAMVLLTALIIILYQFEPDSFKGRLLIWKMGTKMIDSSILTGHGLGFVESKFKAYQDLYFGATNRSIEEKLLAGDTHSLFNEPYRILVESGLIGLLLFSAIMVAVLKHSLLPLYK